MYTLGISALYHDSAACLCEDGRIRAAAQEERFTRKKHDLNLPFNAIDYCLKDVNICMEDIDQVVYYDDPMLTLERMVSNAVSLGEDCEKMVEYSFPSFFQNKIWIKERLEGKYGRLGKTGKLWVTKHHISHAASAFYPSPFEKAAILTIDGVGEWTTTAISVGDGTDIKMFKEIKYPHSLGLLYSAFTYFCGFRVNSGDYKFMGLAPYGEPVYYDLIKNEIIDIKEDGSFKLNLKYFDFYKNDVMTNDKFSKLFGGPRREPESRITKREMDIAASAQKVTEEIIILLAKEAKKITGCENLCIAGGVALNCVANGKLLREKVFENIWIQPAAGDAGGALGCALYAQYALGNVRRLIGECIQKGSYWGPQFSNAEIEKYLVEEGIPYHRFEDQKLFEKIAEELDNQKVIGLSHGRMEFGPRALGNRSIIGDARSEEMQIKMNMKIKYRESFRPFAPSVREENVADYFEMEEQSPYMLLVANVREDRRNVFDIEESLNKSEFDMLNVVKQKRSDVPAITHVDYSARIQTVNEKENPYYYNVINEFYKKTGCAVIVNTSFNVRGEPIVCTPQDAYRCFMRTEMDVLVLENYILYKEEQRSLSEDSDWQQEFELD